MLFHFFFLLNTKEYVLNNADNQTISPPIDLHYDQNSLVTNIQHLQNKVSHTGLEQHEGQEFSFFVELSL